MAMKWASAISEKTNLDLALEECVKRIERVLKSPPDLAVFFISPHFLRSYSLVHAKLAQTLNPKAFFGCSAGGVIGGGREVEQKPGVSITAALLPEVAISPFHISNDDLPDMDARPKSWHDLIGVAPDKDPHFVLLADPFSIDVDKFVMGMDYAYAKSTKVGGLASGGRAPRENALFLNRQTHREGMVGIALSGNVVVDSVVAQGCRPIGRPMLITGCEENVLLELDDQPPMKVLEEIYDSLTPRDKQLLRTSLFLGIVMDSTLATLQRGDFLIRNIVGADPEKGILAIGAELRKGQTVQFHLRDAQTSSEDLELMLNNYVSDRDKKGARGGLLFSCLGRGIYLYGEADHDTKAFQKKLGEIPVGGFFCNGEVGPVHNTTHIHGYTSCFGIFREKEPAKA